MNSPAIILKNRYVIAIFACLLTASSFSNSRADSLWNEWDKFEYNTKQVELFNEISSILGKEEAIKVVLKKFFTANNHLYGQELITAILNQSEWWFKHLKYDIASQFSNLILHLSNMRQSKNNAILVRALIITSYNHRLQGKNVEAIEKLTMAQKIAETLNDKTLTADVYLSLGSLYYEIGD